MTILDFLKQNKPEVIAEEILKLRNLGAAFDIGYGANYFPEDAECPYECRYLEKDNEYECEDYNGMCKLCYMKEQQCPYNIDRKKVVKEQIINWLNSEM